MPRLTAVQIGLSVQDSSCPNMPATVEEHMPMPVSPNFVLPLPWPCFTLFDIRTFGESDLLESLFTWKFYPGSFVDLEFPRVSNQNKTRRFLFADCRIWRISSRREFSYSRFPSPGFKCPLFCFGVVPKELDVIEDRFLIDREVLFLDFETGLLLFMLMQHSMIWLIWVTRVRLVDVDYMRYFIINLTYIFKKRSELSKLLVLKMQWTFYT